MKREGGRKNIRYRIIVCNIGVFRTGERQWDTVTNGGLLVERVANKKRQTDPDCKRNANHKSQIALNLPCLDKQSFPIKRMDENLLDVYCDVIVHRDVITHSKGDAMLRLSEINDQYNTQLKTLMGIERVLRHPEKGTTESTRRRRCTCQGKKRGL